MARDGVLVRRAARSEVHDIAELWRSTGLPPSPRGFPHEVARLRRRDPELVLVAVADARIVGAIGGSYDGRAAVVSRLAVAPAYRGRRVGRLLVDGICASLRELGCDGTALIVPDATGEVAAFWHAIGFRPATAAPSWERPADA